MKVGPVEKGTKIRLPDNALSRDIRAVVEKGKGFDYAEYIAHSYYIECHELYDHSTAHLDFVSQVHLVRRNVDPATVDVNVAMAHYLSRLTAGRGKTQTVNHVVQSPLQLLEQQFTGNTRLAHGLFKISPELVFQGEIHALGLLLFPELQAVTHNLGLAVLAMLAGSKVALFHGALIRKTLGPFEK